MSSKKSARAEPYRTDLQAVSGGASSPVAISES